ncbi:HK97 family phage prohead protease [Bradyrhizobium denitrificans]|uniref:HK97 family phage prohead protease n=1 Tax=Bradyrhizobium denitrificans TaxID=2734912 RepID=UPI0015564910|nr:XkdF-like putative serine protease domain-containing protein [Bradyrhizobium sp. LMG 8443]NPU23950.1 hypothetical protein [Bradyrhizobium sp. LMG 8443]
MGATRRFYGSFAKVDEEQRVVEGYASTEARDAHGEIVLKSAIEDALAGYMEFGNIREMHQLSAVGTAEDAVVDDKGLYLAAKVVDDTAWGKVTKKVYKGFSIGGKVLARDPKNKKIITKILLTEISLVDRPSNPEAKFDLWRAAGSPSTEESSVKKTYVELPATATSSEIVKAVTSAVEAGHHILVGSEREGELLKSINSALAVVTSAGIADMELVDLSKSETTAADSSAEPAEKAVGATFEQMVQGEGAIEKNAGAPDVAEGGAEKDETVAKAADAPAAEAGIPAAEARADPVAKATAVLNAAAEKVAALAKAGEADMQKSMYHVSRFAELLESLSYLVAGTQNEAEFEGDNSPVPAKLREWVKAGSAVFKELAKEEVDEFVGQFKAQKAAAVGDLVKSGEIAVDLEVVGGERLAKAIDDARADLANERDTLVKTIAEKDEALAKMAEHVNSTIPDLLEQVSVLSKRLDDYSQEPAPAKTVGSFAAITKGEDAGGAAALGKAGPAQTQEDIAKALAAMPDDERAMLLIKASHQLPRKITYR